MLLQKVKDRKDDLRAAFRAFDREGSFTVTKGEFRRVIEGFLVPLTQSQFDDLFTKVRKFLCLLFELNSVINILKYKGAFSLIVFSCSVFYVDGFQLFLFVTASKGLDTPSYSMYFLYFLY